MAKQKAKFVIPEAHANPLVRAIKKHPKDFTRKDIVKYIEQNEIRSIHFRYPAKDGKLKELKLPVNNLKDVASILADGERVDGSSLFKGIVDTGNSDMYVVPMYHTAFLNPFVPNCLEFLCRFLDSTGNPSAFTPDNILARAAEDFTAKTGLELKALGELEFYVIYPDEHNLYPAKPQGFYHEAAPFMKHDDLIETVLRLTAEICGGVKYCHSEVGHIQPLESDLPELRNKKMSQYELEFLPSNINDTAARMIIAKWIIRNLAAQRGLLVSFAPKLNIGDAGSGLHIHVSISKNGKNMLTDAKGNLSSTAYSAIGGLLKHAKSITAFGNTSASSYFRLVPHQEAPVKVCWSMSNRSALVRVPLAWRGISNLASKINPQQPTDFKDTAFGQTVELRSPDGSADIHMLLAGMAVALREGLTDGKKYEQFARDVNVTKNIFDDPETLAKLESLPINCWESAQILKEDRNTYEKNGVFPPQAIDFCIKRLEDENDKNLYAELERMSEKQKLEKMRRIMLSTLHCM